MNKTYVCFAYLILFVGLFFFLKSQVYMAYNNTFCKIDFFRQRKKNVPPLPPMA